MAATNECPQWVESRHAAERPHWVESGPLSGLYPIMFAPVANPFANAYAKQCARQRA
jgi:hypothetical protein